MDVDFGFIQKVDQQKGIGWINHHFYNSPTNSTALFYLNNIYERGLFWLIEKDRYSENRIFYTFIHGISTDIVYSLWTNIDSVPLDIFQNIKSLIIKTWMNIDVKKPVWLDEFSEEVFGIEKYKELLLRRRNLQTVKENNTTVNIPIKKNSTKRNKKNNLEKQDHKRNTIIKKAVSITQLSEDRQKSIRDFCNKRGILHLTHFTRISNLNSILKYGLLSQTELEKRNLIKNVIINDLNRFDNCRDAICTTISFPNYKMFYPIRGRVNQNWVVLLLDASILWHLDCAFCKESAASNAVRFINLATRRKIDSLRMIFEDFENIKREDLKIPDHFTTNPQAEVLIFNPIGSKYIQKVIHYNNSSLPDLIRESSINEFKGKLEASPSYFEARTDYKAWI